MFWIHFLTYSLEKPRDHCSTLDVVHHFCLFGSKHLEVDWAEFWSKSLSMDHAVKRHSLWCSTLNKFLEATFWSQHGWPTTSSYPHRSFHYTPCSSKNSDTSGITLTAFVVVSDYEQNKNLFDFTFLNITNKSFKLRTRWNIGGFILLNRKETKRSWFVGSQTTRRRIS